MKKICIICSIVLSLVLSFCSCGKASLNNNSNVTPSNVDVKNSNDDTTTTNQNELNNNIYDKEIVYEITTNSDYNKLAANFNELVQDSDLILKIRVKSTCAFISDNGMIQTEIIPDIQEVYKGKYSNQQLYVNGGEMLYDDFCENEIIKNALSGHENPNGSGDLYGKYVRQIVDKQYVFNIGDEYIFFAEKRPDTGKYYSLYAYQGTYKIIDGVVANAALDNEEPLKKDLNKIFDFSTETNGTETLSSNGNAEVKKISSEESFVNKISDLI